MNLHWVNEVLQTKEKSNQLILISKQPLPPGYMFVAQWSSGKTSALAIEYALAIQRFKPHPSDLTEVFSQKSVKWVYSADRPPAPVYHYQPCMIPCAHSQWRLFYKVGMPGPVLSGMNAFIQHFCIAKYFDWKYFVRAKWWCWVANDDLKIKKNVIFNNNLFTKYWLRDQNSICITCMQKQQTTQPKQWPWFCATKNNSFQWPWLGIGNCR